MSGTWQDLARSLGGTLSSAQQRQFFTSYDAQYREAQRQQQRNQNDLLRVMDQLFKTAQRQWPKILDLPAGV